MLLFFSASENNSGSSSCAPSSKTNLLASIIASSSNLDDEEFQPPLNPTSTITMPPVNFSTRKVRETLLQLHTSKSKDPDGIPTIVLKSCCPELSPVLNKFFHLSYSARIPPSSWKLAHIFPTHKTGTSLTRRTIVQLQPLHPSLRLWRLSSPNNCLPSLKLTTFFLITSMAIDKPDLLVTF